MKKTQPVSSFQVVHARKKYEQADPYLKHFFDYEQVGEAPDPSLHNLFLWTVFLNTNRLGNSLTLSYNIFWTDSQSGGGIPWPFPTTFFDYEQVGEAPDTFLQHFLDWPSVSLGGSPDSSLQHFFYY